MQRGAKGQGARSKAVMPGDRGRPQRGVRLRHRRDSHARGQGLLPGAALVCMCAGQAAAWHASKLPAESATKQVSGAASKPLPECLQGERTTTSQLDRCEMPACCARHSPAWWRQGYGQVARLQRCGDQGGVGVHGTGNSVCSAVSVQSWCTPDGWGRTAPSTAPAGTPVCVVLPVVPSADHLQPAGTKALVQHSCNC